MKKSDPEQARNIRAQVVLQPKGQRNFNQLVTMTRTVTRTSELALKEKMQEYSLRSFYIRFRGEGLEDPDIAKMWSSATTADKFHKKLAFKKGNVVWCWWPLPRTASKKDILSSALIGESEQLHVGQKTAADMLTGSSSVKLDAGSSGHLGAMSNHFDAGDDFNEYDNIIPALGDKPATKGSDSENEGDPNSIYSNKRTRTQKHEEQKYGASKQSFDS